MATTRLGAARSDPERALLTTKLHPPRRRRRTVERRRLTERVDRELPALVLVSAPAGFGKTTLLAEWLADGDGDRTTAWLSLDAGDDDPAVFWTYVVAALQQALPGVGEDALSLLRAAQPGTAVVTSLLNDLDGVDHEVVLVLDDHHVLTSAEVHDALAYLVEHLPPHVHLVISSRADPPLPLGRLRARGELLEIRAADLRFTTEEASAYLNEEMDLDLTSAQVDALDDRTEGWAAALQLAALSMQGREDPSEFVAAFTGNDRFVVDYLAEEVLERQPDEVRRFLLETSLLDRFTAPLCDAVTGRDASSAMLDHLDRANLFLVPLDDRRLWFRYHHLFADVLRARLLNESPERVDDLHRRASAWFEVSDDQPEAIAHALAGHDVPGAARLVELAAPAMRRTRQEATLRRWLTELPAELFATRPVLAIEMVGALMISGDITGVEELLTGIERWLDPAVDASAAVVFDHAEAEHLPAQVEVYRAALALVAGDTGATMAHATRALALARPSDHLRRGSAAALLGLAEWTNGDLEDGARHYTDSIASLTAAGHISDVLGCSIAVADMCTAQGRLDDAVHAYEAGLELARRHHVVRGTADMHVGLAELSLERGDLGAAEIHLDAAARLGEPAGLPQHPYRWRATRAQLRWSQGDRPAALALLEEAERRYDTDMSPPVRPVAATRARALLDEGDLAGGRRWAATSDVSPDDRLTYVREYEHATLARLLLAEGASSEAVALAERLLAAAEKEERAGSRLELLVLLALARDARGDRATACRTLADALASAEAQGHLRVFTVEGPRIEPLLRALVDARPGARRVLASLDPSASPDTVAPRPGPVLVDPLSDRELDVLRMLRGDMTGPEIARELHVSLNTLRTHTRRIYTKLGATNRREAVRRATELGL